MARDGEHKDCSVVPVNIFRLRYGEDEGEELVVSPTHDTVQMFPNPNYTYLRYFNPEEGQLVAIWLGQEVLADLVEGGIPLCIRDSITEQELELYQTHLGKIAANFIDVEEVEEPLALMPGDPIEAEVQKAHEHLDAELDYYMKEWGGDVAS